jgi:hypothetical protein
MKAIKRLFWFIFIRKHIRKRIKIVTGERESFKSFLNNSMTIEDEKYLNSRIEMKNEVLNVLRSLL